MKLLTKTLFSAAVFAASAAYGQAPTQFFADNFNTDTAGQSLSAGATIDTTIGQTAGGNSTSTGQGGWLTNDATQINTATSSQGFQNTVANGGPLFNNTNVGQLLGGYTGPGFFAYAGTNPARLFHTFTQSDPTGVANFGVQLDVDLSITSSANSPTHNGYGIAFETAPGTTAFSINFSPNITPGAEAFDSYTTTAGTTNIPGDAGGLKPGFNLDSRIHLTILITSTNRARVSFIQGGVIVNVLDIALPTGTTPADLTDVAVLEVNGDDVNSTPGPVTAGQDLISFDNLVVAVPEPSTYAMMGLGLLGTLGLMKFRRRTV